MRRQSVALAVAFLLSFVVGNAWGAVQYTVTDLGTFFGGYYSEAYDINASGQVVGWTSSVGWGGFLYGDGKMTKLGTLSSARGINDSGQVVGSANSHAVLDSNGTTTDLGTLPGYSNSGAWDINASGQAVGAAGSSYLPTHAFLYSNGAMTDLGTLPGYSNSYAYGINASGQVVGKADYTTSSHYYHRAFLYSNGKMTDLGTLPGYGYSGANDINDSGQVVGESNTAFLYSNGTMTDLGTPGGPGYRDSGACGINASGQVVGYANTGSGSHAFLYSNGTMIDLTNLVDPASAWILQKANAINDKGQIVGSGMNPAGKSHAFLLSPLPGPTPPPTRPAPPTVAPAPSGLEGLVCVVPGWKSDTSGWADTMKDDITTKLSAAGESGNWAVEAKGWYDSTTDAWLTGISVHTPDFWAGAAKSLGQGFGQEIKDAGYKKVHFIAHSDGAWFIDAATQKIKQLDPTIQVECTFLDPYLTITKSGKGTLGQKADLSESYFSAKDAPFTNSPLDHAYNIDVTNVGDKVTPKVDTTNWSAGHAWPCQWYGQTVNNYDPVSKTGWAYGYGYGFPLSMEMNGGTLPSISDPALGGVKVLPPGTTADELALPLARIDAVLNFGNLAIYQSDTGTKTVEGTKLAMTTGSPVWMTSLLTVTQLVNFVEFQADFTSAAGAEGLLTIYWAGQPMGLIDERWVLDGMQDYVFALPGTSDPGTYELSFRLDPYTGTPSSILIDNVATGYVVPEPSTIILLGAGTASLFAYVWRRRRQAA